MPTPPYIPTDTAKQLRPVIRETMQAAPSRRWTVKALHTFLRGNGFPDASAEDVNAALLWNQSKGYVDFTYNAETESDEWTLTERGKAA